MAAEGEKAVKQERKALLDKLIALLRGGLPKYIRLNVLERERAYQAKLSELTETFSDTEKSVLRELDNQALRTFLDALEHHGVERAKYLHDDQQWHLSREQFRQHVDEAVAGLFDPVMAVFISRESDKDDLRQQAKRTREVLAQGHFGRHAESLDVRSTSALQERERYWISNIFSHPRAPTRCGDSIKEFERKLFGRLLRETREHTNKDQADAAASFKVHRVTYSNWERGVRGLTVDHRAELEAWIEEQHPEGKKRLESVRKLRLVE